MCQEEALRLSSLRLLLVYILHIISSMPSEVFRERARLNIAQFVGNRRDKVKGRIPVYPHQPIEIQRKGEFSIDCLRGSKAVWNLLQRQLMDIHRQVFNDLEGGRVDRWSLDAQFQQTISSPTTELVLLRNEEGKIVGFTSMLPSPVPPNRLLLIFMGIRNKEFQYFQRQGMSFEDYQTMQRKTLIVGETAILPSQRDKGGWSLMMDALEGRAKALKESGDYAWMLRVVRTREGYSEHVRRRFAPDQLIYRRSIDQALGPQEYFRFKL